MNVEAIILAGGLGTRLRSVVNDRPKSMALINGSPFLELLIRALAKKGISRVIISVGYLKNCVLDFFGTEFDGLQIEYVEEDLPLGTGGAIRQALAKVQGELALVLNGDTFVDFDLDDLLHEFRDRESPVLLARRVEDRSRFGKIEAIGRKVVDFNTSADAGPGLINAGVYLVPKNILDQSNLIDPFSFETDFLQKAVHGTNYQVIVTEGTFIDIGTPDDYKDAQDYFGK